MSADSGLSGTASEHPPFPLQNKNKQTKNPKKQDCCFQTVKPWFSKILLFSVKMKVVTVVVVVV